LRAKAYTMCTLMRRKKKTSLSPLGKLRRTMTESSNLRSLLDRKTSNLTSSNQRHRSQIPRSRFSTSLAVWPHRSGSKRVSSSMTLRRRSTRKLKLQMWNLMTRTTTSRRGKRCCSMTTWLKSTVKISQSTRILTSCTWWASTQHKPSSVRRRACSR
jgi:hypothetical protein